MASSPDQSRRAGSPSLLRYGIDAPYVPAFLAIAGVASLVLGIAAASLPWVMVGAFFVLQTVIYLHTTLRGKHIVWNELLDGLELAGTEQLLDVGCGRGAVLIAAAQRLPDGAAHGVDLWKSGDQSGNAETATRSNAKSMGVADRVHLHTADMTELPFDDMTFDVVTSSLAIHNVHTSDGRSAALGEIVRVLRPGGRLVIVDIRHVEAYAAQLEVHGMQTVLDRPLGRRFWFGGPWQSAAVVTATRSRIPATR